MLIITTESIVISGKDFLRPGFRRRSNTHRLVAKFRWPIAAWVLLLGLTNWRFAEAQTFSDASAQAFSDACNSNTSQLQPQLFALCNIIYGNSGGAVQTNASGAGTQSQPNSILIAQKQLKDRRKKNEGNDVIHDSSSDSINANIGEKFNVFLTSGVTALRHRNNDFEQGYNATIPSVTAGIGYHLSDRLETGLAFNYFNSKGDNNNGGGFNVDAYSPLLYINYLPFDNAFANLILGYTRQNQSNRRVGFVENPDPTLVPRASLSRLTTGNVNANLFDLNFLTGYDHPVDSFTIGPRAGIDVRQWEMNSYQESSNTGLELSYTSQYQTSIQSRLGLAASYAHSTTYGVWLPQLTASWVHEYSNNSRIITSKFIQAPGSQPFSFQTEAPARNWAEIDLGVSFVMPKGVQLFANLATVQGNRNFESYGGNLGVQVGW